MDKIKELIEQSIKNIEASGIDTDNLSTLQTLVAVHKNLVDEECQKEAVTMRYRRDYDEDFGARRRDSRGRYMMRDDDRDMGGRYNRRAPKIYFARMMDGYDDYMDSYDEYCRGGNYGAKDKSLEALEYMMDSVVCFIEELQESVDGQESVDIIKKYARKIKEL